MTADIIFAIASVVLTVSLMPTIFGRVFVPRQTSIPIALALSVMALCLVSQGLFFGASMTGIQATQWGVIGIRNGEPT